MAFTSQIISNGVKKYKGRPDVQTSMDADGIAFVNNATIGDEFISNDGAGVGAYKWELTANGWKPFRSDTGWLIFRKTPNASISFRRINDQVFINVDDWSGHLVNIPYGFGYGELPPTATEAQFKDVSQNANYMGISVVSEHLKKRRTFRNPNAPAKPYWDYDVNSKNDLQRAVGVIDINPKNEMYLASSNEDTLWGTANVNHRIPLWLKRNQTDKFLASKGTGVSFQHTYLSKQPYPTDISWAL